MPYLNFESKEIQVSSENQHMFKFLLLHLSLIIFFSSCTKKKDESNSDTNSPPNVIEQPSTSEDKSNKSNYEAPQTSPIRLSSDGSRLFAVNTDNWSLSVFNLEDPRSPVLISETPVGIGPVSVLPINNTEAWVVNNVSDSISVVSVTDGVVTDTFYAGDEPTDILLDSTGTKVFVTASRSKLVKVFNRSTHALIADIPIVGEHPRSLALSADGSKLYVAVALSGNHTTVISRTNSPNPPAEPSVSGLPLATRTALIVDASDSNWSSSILFSLPDHDIAEINTSTHSVSRYIDHVGTVNLGLAINPVSGNLYVSNTEALNLTFYLQNLKGHFILNRVSKVSSLSTTPVVTAYDLNPGLNYNVLPNNTAKSTALAQPTAIVFDPSGNFMWLASLGTDRIAKVDNNGIVLSRIELAGAGGSGANADPENKKGPRGLALKSNSNLLYVMNAISNTISVIDTSSESKVTELNVGSVDHRTSVIKMGRGYLYDAKLSGNGTVSCASCHVDGDTDFLAWNLGDQQGTMKSVTDPISGTVYNMHPMKGPMVTQSLQGLKGGGKFHWRGDLNSINETNVNFRDLMGGSLLSDSDMQKLTDYIESINMPANPNLKLDRSYATTVNGQSPTTGLANFNAAPGPTGFSVSCSSCHSTPDQSFKLQIIPAFGDVRAAKVPSLKHVYKKAGFLNTSGAVSTIGFGQTQDGSVSNMGGGGVSAFTHSWDTGTAPAVGFTFTVNNSNYNQSSLLTNWTTIETRAKVGDNGILVYGISGTTKSSYLYSTSQNNYIKCGSSVEVLTQAQILTLAQNGGYFTVLGVNPENARCSVWTNF